MNGLPRLDHVRAHVPPRVRPMLEDLLRAETYATIAARTHWSVRQIDFAVQALKLVYMPDDLDFPSNNSSTYSRFVALRVAAGLDPCWCEA